MPTNNEKPKTEKRARQVKVEKSVGEVIDLITENEWNLLTDLYFCRCIPQTALRDIFYLGTPQFHYPEYEKADNQQRINLEILNRKRATLSTRRGLNKLKNHGLVESSNYNPEASALPAHMRKSASTGETWYYLSARGLRVIEKKREVLEDNRLSKHELDMDRAKKNHFWGLAKVYLDLKYKILNQMDNIEDMKQFIDWDWYPSLAIYSDEQITVVRPDAILRIGEQLFYVELDRSTEPVQRSPFHNDQVSIQKKIAKYRDVMKLSSITSIREGIIAFILPEAVNRTRINNIISAAETVIGEKHRVLAGKSISEIIEAYPSVLMDK